MLPGRSYFFFCGEEEAALLLPSPSLAGEGFSERAGDAPAVRLRAAAASRFAAIFAESSCAFCSACLDREGKRDRGGVSGFPWFTSCTACQTS